MYTKAQSKAHGEKILAATKYRLRETFSAIPRFETVRIVLSLVVQLHWHVYQF